MSDKTTWQRVKFGDVVQLNRDRIADPLAEGIERYVGIEHIEPEDLRIRSWGLVEEGTTFTNGFQPGQVLFVKRRAYQRKVAVADFAGVCSSDIYVLEPKDPDLLLPDLLPFICQTEGFFEHAVGTSAGSLSPRTNWSQLANYEFALPPLAEQRRIAEVLWATTELANNYKALAEQTQKLWQSLAFHLFTDINSFGVVKLGELLSYGSDGPFGSKLKTSHYVNRGVQVVRLQNIDPNRFNDADRAYISEEYYRNELSGYTICARDVLVAGLGDENIQAGRACIAPGNLGIAINKADCFCLRPNSRLDSKYLVAFFNSPQGLRQSESYSQGTTRYRLNLGNIKQMKIPLPAISVQGDIAGQLEAAFEAEQQVNSRHSHQIIVIKALLNSLI